jgi:hypothetical protein
MSEPRKSSFSASNGCVVIDIDGEGVVQVHDSKDPDGPILQFGRHEWEAFIRGVKKGEFDLPAESLPA